MVWIAWLSGVGALCELIGLGVAGYGISTTWKANASGHDKTVTAYLRRQIVAALKRGAWWVNARFPSWLRRRQSQAVSLGTTEQIQATDRAYVVKVEGTLAATLPALEAIAELDERLQRIQSAYQDADNQIRQQVDALSTRLDHGERLTRDVEQSLGEQVREVHLSGLPMQAVGLWLVALGLLLQIPGQVVVDP